MMNELNFPTPPDPPVELAKERNRDAADRTLLSWSRITVSFMGIGFGIEQILSTLGVNNRIKLGSVLTLRVIGMLFLGLGVVTILVAALDYQGELRRFRQPVYRYTSRPSIGMFVATVLLILAVVILALLCFKQI